VLAVLAATGKRMSELARTFEPAPQILENVRFSGGEPLKNAGVRAAIAEGEARLNGSGRVLVRASGTEPLIRVMAEGDDCKLVATVVKDICEAVRAAKAYAAAFRSTTASTMWAR
jgi:phosphoglucosamine mutase